MWLILSIVCLAIGVCLIIYGKTMDTSGSENYTALGVFIVGLVLCGASGLSEVLRWFVHSFRQ